MKSVNDCILTNIENHLKIFNNLKHIQKTKFTNDYKRPPNYGSINDFTNEDLIEFKKKLGDKSAFTYLLELCNDKGKELNELIEERVQSGCGQCVALISLNRCYLCYTCREDKSLYKEQKSLIETITNKECLMLVELISQEYKPEILSDDNKLFDYQLELKWTFGYYTSAIIVMQCKSVSRITAIEKLIARSTLLNNQYIERANMFNILYSIVTDTYAVVYDDINDVIKIGLMVNCG